MADPISQFIDDLEFHSAAHAEIVRQVRALYQKVDPTIGEKFIYGGIGFYVGDTHIGGVYGHKEHVNIVFSRGNELADPDDLLAGKGKYRRHIRATVPDEIEAQKVHTFIEQAIHLEKKS